MKFTLNWLKEYVDFDLTVEELCDRLTMLGLEVDSVTDLYRDLDGVRVARIDRVEPHPNAGKLSICDVTVDGVTERVVCGAPNARPGLWTAFTPPGVTLPSGIIVKEAKIRGEVSRGMLCSEKDLGISEDHSGIMEISGTAAGDGSLVEVLGLRDTLIEVDLTPNRPDCACLAGIAREVAGFTGGKLKIPQAEAVPELSGDVPFGVDILAFDACPRYAARMLKNVTIGPSPWWLRKRLLAVGMRPINNVVDVTNLVMMELGQPLHAFDFNRLAGGRIVVRKAAAGERMVTLDGVARELDPEMLLICDAEKAVAIAGVMGGENSEVGDDTKDILLESAYFNPVSIRRTARQLKMGTEASYRFERGIDPEGVTRALARTTRLIAEVAAAEIVPGGVDCRTGMTPPRLIELRISRTNDLIGMTLSRDEIVRSLTGIEITVEKKNDDVLIVRPPSFRVDLEREVDLVEEIARIKGFNEIPSSLPRVPMNLPVIDENRKLRQKIASIMIAQGFTEVINYSFVTEKHFDQLNIPADDAARKTVRLLNPLNEEQSIMRSLLLPGILENLKWNINRQSIDVHLFETGKVFLQEGDELPREKTMMVGVLSGRRSPKAPVLHFGDAAVDIYDVKGIAEVVLQELRLAEVVTTAAGDETVPTFAESGYYAELQLQADRARRVGCFGKISWDVLKSFFIKQDAYFIELDIDAILELSPVPKVFSSLPRFPAVTWDVAVIVPERVAAGEMLKAVYDLHETLVEKAEIFDIYKGKGIEKGSKSVAISITYRSEEKTLDDETVDTVHQNIIKTLENRFQGRLREAN